MTEYESGSTGDSAPDSGASSDGGGVDLSPLFDLLFDSILEPSRRPVSVPAEPSAAERRRRGQFEAMLRAIMEAPPPPDSRSLVRRIAETDRWFVPTTQSGAFERLTGADERVRRAFTRPLVRGEPDRRLGRGNRPPTRLLAALGLDPGRPASQLTGLELARAIPADVDGLLCFFDSGDAAGLRRDELHLLAQVADAFDLEDILVNPAPGQVEALQSGRWYVPASNHQLRPDTFNTHHFVLVYTHPDRAEPADWPLTELDGETLFSRLASRGDYDGIAVNFGSQTGRGEAELQVLLLGPNVARGIVRGIDSRPGAAPLPARTLAEVLLWLDLAEFPGPPFVTREIVEVRPPDIPASGQTGPGASEAAPETVYIQVRADIASPWRIVETWYEQPKRPGPIWSPVFAVAWPDAAPDDLGDGQTQILCAGKLARHLYRHNTWLPPRWLVRRTDREQAARRWRWAHELEKLLPPGADRLPRATIRTVDGARFLRDRSTFQSRAWVHEQLERYERAAHRRFVL